MTARTRIGILGGTLDPVHSGHIDTALAARAALGLDRVLVMPSGLPPHRTPPVASRFHRFAMAALAVSGVDGLEVSDLEIGSDRPCYTFETLERLHENGLAADEIFFITGADAFAEIGTWRRFPEVLDMAQFVVVSRPGFPIATLRSTLPSLAPRMRNAGGAASTAVDGTHATWVLLLDAATRDVSSTTVRRNREAGRSIADLVPPAVGTYIEQHRLYTQRVPAATLGNSLA
jgi:nicotinate-nucleotide adenylyltransferase